MKRVKRIIRERYLTIIAIVLLIISITGVVNNYLVDSANIIGHTMSDVRGVYFEMLSYQSGFLIFSVPLSLMLIIIDFWHNKFKNGNIKNYLIRMPYKDFKKKLFISIAKISLLYPLLFFIFLLISFVLAKGQNNFSSIITYSAYYDIWSYNNFFQYAIKTILLLYIQGILASCFTLIFLNRIKNKILVILFSYITFLISLVGLQIIPYMFLDICFNYKIDQTYLNFYTLKLYCDSSLNFLLYLLSICSFTFLLLTIIYIFLYRKKEKVILTNEKEMV